MIDIRSLATGLEYGEDGIWFADKQEEISYPKDGHAQCFSIEDDSYWFDHRVNCILEAMHLFPPGEAVFDVGGGNGHVSLALVKAGIYSVLVEPGYDGARNARQRGLPTVVCSTVEGAGFHPHVLPAIGVFDVIEHIKNDEQFLAQAHRLLVPKGRLYVTVPAHRILWSVEDVAAGHYRRYSLKDLASKLDRAGFDVEFATHLFSALPLPIFVLRSIPTKLGFRNRRKHERNRREHQRPSNLLGAILNYTLERELHLLRNKRPVSLGSTCLVIAASRAD